MTNNLRSPKTATLDDKTCDSDSDSDCDSDMPSDACDGVTACVWRACNKVCNNKLVVILEFTQQNSGNWVCCEKGRPRTCQVRGRQNLEAFWLAAAAAA